MHVRQHELDTADRLAQTGLNVVFRQPTDESTSDVYVEGVKAELKSTRSTRLGNVERQITKKRRKQGPNFILDISDSPLPLDLVASRMAELCGEHPDEEITSIMVVDARAGDPVGVKIVGGEVSQWRR